MHLPIADLLGVLKEATYRQLALEKSLYAFKLHFFFFRFIRRKSNGTRTKPFFWILFFDSVFDFILAVSIRSQARFRVVSIETLRNVCVTFIFLCLSDDANPLNKFVSEKCGSIQENCCSKKNFLLFCRNKRTLPLVNLSTS